MEGTIGRATVDGRTVRLSDSRVDFGAGGAPQREIRGEGDGDGTAGRAAAFTEAAGWPIFAEPIRNARPWPNAVTTYSQLIATPEVVDRYRPERALSWWSQSANRD